MNRFRASAPPGRRRGGFTLVELLVVIGIIALLISILLPSLQSARRAANSVKCLSSLRSIGQAFELYANDYKGVWPSTRDRVQKAAKNNHSWTDLIAKYMTKKDFKNGYQDISDIRRNSVLWGCPEWTQSNDWQASANTAAGVNVYTGYGMQYYPDSDGYFIKGDTSQLASSTVQATDVYTRSGYVKAVVWKRKGAERMLIADSPFDQISLTNVPWSSAVNFAPYNAAAVAAFTSPTFAIDARHIKRTANKQMAMDSKSLNVLFCDGHAAPASAKEAFIAVRSPGREKLPQDP